MRTLRNAIIVLVLAWSPLSAYAQAVDAPTGTYKGTLVHERKLTWKQTDPPRVVSQKATTKSPDSGSCRPARRTPSSS